MIGAFFREAFGGKALLAKRDVLLKATDSPRDLYYLFGETAVSQKLYAQAIKDFIKAQSMTPNPLAKSNLELRLAMIYQQLGELTKSEKSYLKVLRDQPQNIQALNNLAYLYVDKLKNPKKGLLFIEQALKRRPGDLNLMDTYGWTLYKLGNIEKAHETLEDVVKRDLTNADTLYHIAVVKEAMAAKQKEPELLLAALGFYRQALAMVEKEPKNPIRSDIETGLARVRKKLEEKKE